MNDLISKLSEMRSNYNCFNENEEPYYRALSEAIQLASAQPERTGKWIRHPEQRNIYGGKTIECSECQTKYVVQYIEDEKYCRNCGARMES